MATPLNTIFSWFQTGDFPTEQQFQATFSSFWHRDEAIPVGSIQGLAEMFQGTASSSALKNHIDSETPHTNVLAKRDASNLGSEEVEIWRNLILEPYEIDLT